MSQKPTDMERRLKLRRCPHCGVSSPDLVKQVQIAEPPATSKEVRYWSVYVCSTCAGAVLVEGEFSPSYGMLASRRYPDIRSVNEAVPDKARALLNQALESIHAPSGAVMLAASAIDAMLKAKGLAEGSLYNRIDKAGADNLITDEMRAWAHEIRLDANDERHADVDAGLPEREDAERCVAFAEALAEFLFVLPARVKRGREASKQKGK